MEPGTQLYKIRSGGHHAFVFIKTVGDPYIEATVLGPREVVDVIDISSGETAGFDATLLREYVEHNYMPVHDRKAIA